MLENLESALRMAFGECVLMRRVCDQMLAIQIGPIELVINDFGELCAVSGAGVKSLEVGVDSLCGSVSPAGAAVETSV